MYPFAEQVLAYQAENAERRAAALVLEVKSDFCQKSAESWKSMAAGRITLKFLSPTISLQSAAQ
jgi:hypothetical protein